MTDIFEELDQAVGLAPDPDVPEDAMTAVEYAERKGITRHSARYRLERAFQDGALDRRKTYRPGSDGRMIEQWVYWPKE